ncbi:MAG: helix-turn-helix domain-containing protein [Dietzia sp.]
MYREWELPQAEVRCAWSVEATTGGWWTQPATEFWGLGFSSTAGGVRVELVGPAAHPQRFELQAGDRAWGVELHAHVFLRVLSKASIELVQVLPSDAGGFRLGDRDHAIPDQHHLGELIDELVAEGVLSTDPTVALALSGRGQQGGRTLRRHVRGVAGLNRQQIAGIERARTAFRLLSEGVGISDVVELAGYSDQAHLTRSLRALAGRTPREILSGR